MHNLITTLYNLATTHAHDRTIRRSSIALAKRLQELNPQDND